MKKKFVAVIAILCIIGIMCAFVACQKNDGGTTPSGQPSGQPSGSIDSGDTIPSGSIDSGEITSGNQQPSGDIGDKEDISSGTIPPSGEITSGEVSSGEQQPEEPVFIQSITDLVENYSDIVYSALVDNFLEGAGKAMYGSRSFDAENFTSISFDLGTSDEINEIKLISTYATNSATSTYSVCIINLNQTIKVSDLTEDIITSTINNTTASYTKDYSFNFSPAIQDSRAALTNAICDKIFGENPNAIRYIVDNGYSGTDSFLGEVGGFTVIEIDSRDIHEISIRIKYSQSDEEYIDKLNDQIQYRITSDEKSYTLSGNIITQPEGDIEN